LTVSSWMSTRGDPGARSARIQILEETFTEITHENDWRRVSHAQVTNSRPCSATWMINIDLILYMLRIMSLQWEYPQTSRWNGNPARVGLSEGFAVDWLSIDNLKQKKR
jgi:hypothetical protein